MFLPMSWTSPLTVAMTIVPLGRRPPESPSPLASLLGLDERHEVADRLLHHPRGLDDLRQEHLAGPEQVADDVHPRHERALDDLDRPPAGRLDLRAQRLGVGFDVLVDPLDQGVRDPLAHRQGAPLLVGRSSAAGRTR